MSSSKSSSSHRDDQGNIHLSFCRKDKKGACEGSNWSMLNIAAMVVGFIFFWPVGLLVLFWILSGRNIKDLPGAIGRKWSSMVNGGNAGAPNESGHYSENSVFNDFQQTQYDRISEIKEEIVNRARHFKTFRADAQRRADEDEFNQFMGKKPDSGIDS